MASTPNQEAIDTFISITGASNAVALQKLEEHRGDLNQAVNAYFSEGARNVVHEAPVNALHDDEMDIDDVIPAPQSPLSMFNAARTIGRPFSLLDSDFARGIFDSDPLMPRPPFVSHPREVRQIPIEVKDSSSGPSGRSSDAPTIEDVTETTHVQGPATQGTVIIDEESDDDIPYAPRGQSRQDGLAGSVANNNQDYNDIEEEMIRAAIEASKKEAGGSTNPLLEERPPHMEDDDDIAKAVTMSLKSAEEEVLRGQGYKASTSEIGASEVTAAQGPQDTQALNGRLAAPSSPFEDDSDDVDEQPLIRHRPRRAASGSLAPPNVDRSRSGSPEEERASINPEERGSGFPSEWGGISSEEHDEAVMLEAAMFGGIPETGYNPPLPFLPPQPRAQPPPPSPSLTAQRLIREQQDDEYLASLQADRDKEIKSIREEETARKAFLEEEKKKEEEAQRKLEEEQELERQLDAKEASLSKEPQADEENAITLLIRMPDGTRRGRRFLKSDKLRSLFNFIDIARVVKPNTYRLVRPYPRHAFGDGESESTLNDLGLTSKQEALFLELI
ncbi:PREDICTED: plant UBX domain-containing protein 8-like [Camelina sativa]|uniref:Plant UBX domain-containing protein 8-like n=1 Tax=Camelina sativa TaxID=90675 RepID=A0ABM0VFZ5_CAMSA|nr:PREDICTED: plant UBX domain-containing protein 8-like [Camelina sativa]